MKKYIYCHPQTDCYVVSQFFSVARHVGRLKLGSKPAQLCVRLSIRPHGRVHFLRQYPLHHRHLHIVIICMCVFARVYAWIWVCWSVCVCVCVWEREREREIYLISYANVYDCNVFHKKVWILKWWSRDPCGESRILVCVYVQLSVTETYFCLNWLTKSRWVSSNLKKKDEASFSPFWSGLLGERQVCESTGLLFSTNLAPCDYFVLFVCLFVFFLFLSMKKFQRWNLS